MHMSFVRVKSRNGVLSLPVSRFYKHKERQLLFQIKPVYYEFQNGVSSINMWKLD